ncbi:uncharacterized protein LOC122876571 [Siniperca chuatsi]|uniref:uncharacterized protein LOC122876571 n=1 Tax=Siniperca chuatsi TaxID=119488 RepID=UPI001CE057F2|nr:uncharacterized protein LOC122876571 [Siniperca chuatsi]
MGRMEKKRRERRRIINQASAVPPDHFCWPGYGAGSAASSSANLCKESPGSLAGCHGSGVSQWKYHPNGFSLHEVSTNPLLQKEKEGHGICSSHFCGEKFPTLKMCKHSADGINTKLVCVSVCVGFIAETRITYGLD